MNEKVVFCNKPFIILWKKCENILIFDRPNLCALSDKEQFIYALVAEITHGKQ